MDRETVALMLENVLDIASAAKYMDLSKSQFMILVENQKLKPIKDHYFFKGDLDDYLQCAFSLKNPHVKEAMFYYTMMRFLDDDEVESQHVLAILESEQQFDLRAPFYENLAIVTNYLHIPEVSFYKYYMEMEAYFMNLPLDTRILCKDDPSYPIMIKDEENAPYYLFVRGNLSLLDQNVISIVGSEHPREDEINKALYLCHYFERDQKIIATGLERGINTYLAMEMMKQQCPGILILSSSFLDIYPKENRQLYEYMCEKGLVITQFIYHRYYPINIKRRNMTLASIASLGILTGGKDQSELCDFAYEVLKENKPLLLPSSMKKSYMHFPSDLISKGAHYFSSVSELKKLSN